MWIKCSERLPDKPGAYLVAFNGQFYAMAIRYFYKECFYQRMLEYVKDDFLNDLASKYNPVELITHWQPLPEPPKEDE